MFMEPGGRQGLGAHGGTTGWCHLQEAKVPTLCWDLWWGPWNLSLPFALTNQMPDGTEAGPLLGLTTPSPGRTLYKYQLAS